MVKSAAFKFDPDEVFDKIVVSFAPEGCLGFKMDAKERVS